MALWAWILRRNWLFLLSIPSLPFANAGFSTLYGNLGNELVLHNHNLLYITISFLVILGSIGFPILVNLYETVSYESKRLYHRYVKKNKRTIRKIHLYNLNTRIVLIMTAYLAT